MQRIENQPLIKAPILEDDISDERDLGRQFAALSHIFARDVHTLLGRLDRDVQDLWATFGLERPSAVQQTIQNMLNQVKLDGERIASFDLAG